MLERDWWSKVGLFIYTQFEIDKEKSEQQKAKVRLGSGRWISDNRTETLLYYVIYLKKCDNPC